MAVTLAFAVPLAALPVTGLVTFFLTAVLLTFLTGAATFLPAAFLSLLGAPEIFGFGKPLTAFLAAFFSSAVFLAGCFLSPGFLAAVAAFFAGFCVLESAAGRLVAAGLSVAGFLAAAAAAGFFSAGLSPVVFLTGAGFFSFFSEVVAAGAFSPPLGSEIKLLPEH